MTDNTDGEADVVDGCKPCEVYAAFNEFCATLGRTKKMKRVQGRQENVQVDTGQNACGLLSTHVYDGNVDPQSFYKALVELYGEDAVRDAAIEHLMGDDALQKREIDEPSEQPPQADAGETEGGTGEQSGPAGGSTDDSAPASTPPAEQPQQGVAVAGGGTNE